MDKSEQKLTFQPSSLQLKFAEIYLIWWEKKTMEDIAKEIGCSRTTIWKWFNDENFVNWLNGKKNELLNKSLISRYKIAVRKAEAGDFQFAKLLFEMQGEYIPQQKTESESLVKVIIEDVYGKNENKKNKST